ncbi:hypothetical protein E6P09_05360 [Haloferax mediterranei ATCC 33500]|uniref:Uncharacterized protein n=1 Tax=Haloferax mediterranei (strain ATCC 33500 / DSM 1411 / JCM 8866 / NBRC 14739 / NCIMB 2177 / R-4) TaxID=523841 RepID=I3R1T5_HALMT|nr:hypothetical protein [Haloferax mediterranei]AFK18195.1 hypothetical protein HFX_0460 [Haloferax mediterranei ATCC 33500]AHZ22400.1 hypothetical protein BM92_06955 [Haloferax mediterranei ATCC 33500]EMA02531.1 hypothetical protein C439_08110 [Haloferax mediterranei ATCC 33500]MDX5988285.1 hypothetical protein [Haloferax mediterranei ATCC 33500]QCQ74722.1 hypothetical protein E6P09_05360 [Haloferax mediterranei ATCC 33500]
MPVNWSRRSLLTTLGAVGLTGLPGCSELQASARGATDIVLHNEATNTRTIDVLVTERSTDSTKVDTTIELEPNKRQTINNKVIMEADYDVEITFSDPSFDDSPYTESYEWNDAGQPLHVIVHDQIVFAVQVG